MIFFEEWILVDYPDRNTIAGMKLRIKPKKVNFFTFFCKN